ncbi:branched-chain amino acid ABC transporter permease [Oricola thermophila]|uniref:Branched-chain amino acid ABC transporter permease n=1 Tax=Oricola thermophila TaxID=2742145 RepID=A0A6N1V9C6_9HYPH|nr:branched-chain amino acid ABC transporter permease [Oricola thermophila]QKV17601.1 branched-chain amino acid ABC transporter permease [Oricola thermophila]
MIALKEKEWRVAGVAILLFGVAAMIPFADDGYYLSLAVNIVMYVVLCTAWTLFSGPTHYISLATAAFFGMGTYSVGLGIDSLPFPLLIGIGALAGGVLAGLVGMATLRLSGVYFVIFTLGLAELVRQVVTWLQVKFVGAVGLYVFTELNETHIFWMLLALAAAVFLAGWLISRSRLGFAMRIIGNDETVARHVGIDVARSKVILFTVSGAFIAAAGAILAPRFAYVEPPSAFNPVISFQVVIMALLGGTGRLWAPLLGVVPFTILFDRISASFPNHTSLLIGVAFMAVVYFLPRGVIGLVEDFLARHRKRDLARGRHISEAVE